MCLTPGELEMRQMVEEGYVDGNTVRTVGTSALVLVVPRGNRANVRTLSDLAKPSVRAMGIADWELNPAGYYAKLALERAGLLEKVKGNQEKREDIVGLINALNGDGICYPHIACNAHAPSGGNSSHTTPSRMSALPSPKSFSI